MNIYKRMIINTSTFQESSLSPPRVYRQEFDSKCSTNKYTHTYTLSH